MRCWLFRLRWAASLLGALALSACACERRGDEGGAQTRQENADTSEAKGLARAELRPEDPRGLPEQGSGLERPESSRAPSEPPDPDTLYVCVSNADGGVVQRVALPGGEAFVVSQGPSGFRVSEGRIGQSARDEIGQALQESGFFSLPERLPEASGAVSTGAREWNLRAATRRRRHEVHALEGGALTGKFLEPFALCERAFADLDSHATDPRGALAVYRTLEDQAKALPAGDPRRALLLEWLDSLQGDYQGHD